MTHWTEYEFAEDSSLKSIFNGQSNLERDGNQLQLLEVAEEYLYYKTITSLVKSMKWNSVE